MKRLVFLLLVCMVSAAFAVIPKEHRAYRNTVNASDSLIVALPDWTVHVRIEVVASDSINVFFAGNHVSMAADTLVFYRPTHATRYPLQSNARLPWNVFNDCYADTIHFYNNDSGNNVDVVYEVMP